MKLPRLIAHQRHRPLRMISELAEEFGVSTSEIGAAMKYHPGAPSPVIDGRLSRNVNQLNWYDPVAFRAWWASFDHTPSATAVRLREWRKKQKDKA